VFSFPRESIATSECISETLPEKVQDWHYMVRGLMRESVPEAVATGLMLNRCYQQADWRLNVRLFKVDCLAGRYHHPTRAARVGTPVRFRF
jgi:hypothetical protein